MSSLAVVILAAGLGKRMVSQTPKVLHPLLGQPMLGHVLDAATQPLVDFPVAWQAEDPATVITNESRTNVNGYAAMLPRSRYVPGSSKVTAS